MRRARAVVFCGPTLSPDIVGRYVDARCLPPVAQGDVYRVSLEQPWAIGIIDGYFELEPAVWHKEILWAMSRGIHVFGASSMGALRACELAPYGMVGVGAIFEAFREGRLEDDDEVAVRHAPSDSGFAALSEAMVNIRATLDEAVRENVIGAKVQDALVAIAKETFYGERTYDAVLEKARKRHLAADELEALTRWLPKGRVDQKARDAVAMLEHMRALEASEPAPMRAPFRFEHTEMWEQVGRRRPPSGTAGSPEPESEARDILEELRLEGWKRFHGIRSRAAERTMGLEQAERQGLAPTGEHVESVALTLRRSLGLHREEAFREWLAAEAMTEELFMQLVEDEAKLAAVRELFSPEIDGRVADVLRLERRYGTLLDRARRKRESLSESGLTAPDVGGAEEVSELLGWWFERELGEPLPEDLEGYARGLGCKDAMELIRILARERAFRELGGA